MVKDEFRWQDWLWLCIAASMGLMAILAIVPGYGKIGTWLGDKDAPAWVQAVGSVLAILVAIGVAWWQKFVDRKEKREKDTAAAVIVIHTVYLMLKDVEFWLETVVSGWPADVNGTAQPLNIERIQYALDQYSTPSDEQLLRMIPEIGQGMVGVIMIIRKLKETVQINEKMLAQPRGTLWSMKEQNFLRGVKTSYTGGLAQIQEVNRAMGKFVELNSFMGSNAFQ